MNENQSPADSIRAGYPFTPEQDARDGIVALVMIAGENSRDHGFHDDWPREEGAVPVSQRELGMYVTEKLALIHEEISEALGEIRDGRHPRDVYYSDTMKYKEGTETSVHEEQSYAHTEEGITKPLFKPEGFGIELADAVIRIADLAYLTGIDLGRLVIEKHEYNKTRAAKHGRKF